MKWRIELFGHVSARLGDHVVDRFATRKIAELLGALALRPGQSFTRDQLGQMLWPESDDVEAVRVRLRQAIMSLRRQLEPPGIESGSVVVAHRDLVWLNPERTESDAADFDVALALLHTVPPEGTERPMAAVVHLYRGDLMPELNAPWILTEQIRFQEAFSEVADRLIPLWQTKGEWSSLAELLKGILRFEPYDESRQRLLMTALHRSGASAEALESYEKFRTRLAEDIHEEVEPETASLAEAIRSEGGQMDTVVPTAKSPMAPARRFPIPTSRFFGRERELEAIHKNLSEGAHRIVTLIGPGGTGKTRVALELAERVYFERSGEVWFVPLADLGAAHEIAQAIVRSLNVPVHQETSMLDTIVWELQRYSRPILIFDNFEHLVDEGALVVHELLSRLPGLTCLITSRHRLDLDGEQEVQVPLLEIPPSEVTSPEELMRYAAIQLFVDRARLGRPDFGVTERNAAAIGELCRRLEGIPLALETCASLATTVTPAQMLDGLRKRFELLVSRRRDIVARHRTIRSAVEYSYRLLPEDLADIFRRLAVFQGGWTVEAVEAILGVPNAATAMQELRDRSLIMCEEVTIQGEPEMRFRMLETFREFGWEMVSAADQDALGQAHLQYFLAFAKANRERYFAGVAGTDELEHDRSNLISAIRCALTEDDVQTAFELCNALFHFWTVRWEQAEGLHWYQAAFDHSGAAYVPLEIRVRAARAVTHLTKYSAHVDRFGRSLDLYRQLADELGDRAEQRHVHACYGDYLNLCGDIHGSLEVFRNVLEEARSTNDEKALPGALLNISGAYREIGEYERALEAAQEALGWIKAAGQRINRIVGISTVAECLERLGRFEEAERCHLDLIRRAKAINADNWTLSGTCGLANFYLGRGKHEQAADALCSAIHLVAEVRAAPSAVHGIRTAACLAAAMEEYETSAVLLASVDGLPPSRWPNVCKRAEKLPAQLRDRLGSRFETEWARGTRLDRRQSVRIVSEFLCKIT